MKVMHVEPADASIQIKGGEKIVGAISVEKYDALIKVYPELKEQFKEVEIAEPKPAKLKAE
jgi:hypothetical protein